MTTYKGLTLDKFQENAIHAIENNHSVVVSAPTGSGKTLTADYIIDRDLKTDKKIVYTAPIKALSNQKYKEFSAEYGKDKVGLLTGDLVLNPGGQLLIMTTEIYRNMVVADEFSIKDVSYVIFDEIHYINDIERGYIWEESIIFSPEHIRFLCLSATIPNAKEFADWIGQIKHHEVDVVNHDIRAVPLTQKFFDAELGLTNFDRLKLDLQTPDYNTFMGKKSRKKPQNPVHIDLIKEIQDKTPCIFFCFSRVKCQKFAEELAKKKLFAEDPKIKTIIRKKLEELSDEVKQLKSTNLLRQLLPKGVGFHHAGLLPGVKEIIEDLFSQGYIKVLYTTETFAVGINMPAKTVVIESVRKFDGRSFRPLNTKEFFQIAGRAGRRGIDTEGLVVLMINRADVTPQLLKKLTTKDTLPISSQFQLSVNTVLNLYARHSLNEIEKILDQSFLNFQKSKAHTPIKSRFYALIKRLDKMKYISRYSLTDKGTFAAQVYSDEIILSELFATDFKNNLTIFQILLLLASLAYEERGKKPTKFHKLYVNKECVSLKKKVKNHSYLKTVKRLTRLEKLTGLAYPIYNKQTIFEAIKNTDMPEGNLVRLVMQINDRLTQIKEANPDKELTEKLHECRELIDQSLEGIKLV